MGSPKTVANHLTVILKPGRILSGHFFPAGTRFALCWVLLIQAAGLSASVLRAQAPQELAYAVVVTGLGGEPAYEKLIEGWGKDLYTVLKSNGLPEDRLFWLAASRQKGVYAESRREQIVQLLEKLAARIRPEDVFQLFLIGHGSYDEYDYRFSIPGPDLTASQWNELLGRIRAGKQVVINMTSSSGASLPVLQRKGRVVIASTSAGRERNFSVFARYFIEALQESAADANKNEEISALEAFRYATHEVSRYYESYKRLATEHALLEDRGEGEGSREATPETRQGLLASSIALVHLGGSRTVLDTPEVRELRARKRKLEEAIEEQKYRKAALDTEEYFQELERLLLELSTTQQRLDGLENAEDPNERKP